MSYKRYQSSSKQYRQSTNNHGDDENSSSNNSNNNNNNNKVDVQFPYILVWKLHTQACEIVAGTKKKLCKKFQVDICKTKKDRSAHAELRTL